MSIGEVGDAIEANVIGQLPYAELAVARECLALGAEQIREVAGDDESSSLAPTLVSLQAALGKLAECGTQVATADEATREYLESIGLSPSATALRRQKELRGRQYVPEWTSERDGYRASFYGADEERPEGSLADQFERQRYKERLPKPYAQTVDHATQRIEKLLSHLNLSATRADGQAPLGVTSQEGLRYLAQVAAHVITRWGVKKQDRPNTEKYFPRVTHRGDTYRPDFRNQDERMAVEVAAIVSELQQFGYGHPLVDVPRFAEAIAVFGPEYMKQWAAGEQLRDYCRQQNLDYNTISQTLTQHYRNRILLQSNHDPVGALRQVVDRLTGPLHPERIAARTGWPLEKVRAYFLPGIIANAALDKGLDPDAFVRELTDRINRQNRTDKP